MVPPAPASTSTEPTRPTFRPYARLLNPPPPTPAEQALASAKLQILLAKSSPMPPAPPRVGRLQLAPPTGWTRLGQPVSILQRYIDDDDGDEKKNDQQVSKRRKVAVAAPRRVRLADADWDTVNSKSISAGPSSQVQPWAMVATDTPLPMGWAACATSCLVLDQNRRDDDDRAFAEVSRRKAEANQENERKRSRQEGELPPASDNWTCDQCATMNPNAAKECRSCHKVRTVGCWGTLFANQARRWQCPSCAVFNDEALDECAACNVARPGSKGQSKAAPAPVAEPVAAAPLPGEFGASGFSFPTPATTMATTPKVSDSGTAFGATAVEIKSPAGGGFRLGAAPTEQAKAPAPSTGAFSLGVTPAEQKEETKPAAGFFPFAVNTNGAAQAPTNGGFSLGTTESKSTVAPASKFSFGAAAPTIDKGKASDSAQTKPADSKAAPPPFTLAAPAPATDSKPSTGMLGSSTLDAKSDSKPSFSFGVGKPWSPDDNRPPIAPPPLGATRKDDAQESAFSVRTDPSTGKSTAPPRSADLGGFASPAPPPALSDKPFRFSATKALSEAPPLEFTGASAAAPTLKTARPADDEATDDDSRRKKRRGRDESTEEASTLKPFGGSATSGGATNGSAGMFEFGKSAAGAGPVPVPFQFGAASGGPAPSFSTSSNSFGDASTATAPSQSLAVAPKEDKAKEPAPFAFGSSSASQPSADSSGPAPFVFGSSTGTASTSTQPFTFGAGSSSGGAAPQPAFGSTSTAPAPPSFGSNMASAPSTTFRASAPAATFGSSVPAATFGSSAPSPRPFNNFGSSAPAPQGDFGAPFGSVSSSASSGAPFGGPVGAGTGSQFGQPTGQFGAPPGPVGAAQFGAPSNTAPSGGFGSAPAPVGFIGPSAMGGFGGVGFGAPAAPAPGGFGLAAPGGFGAAPSQGAVGGFALGTAPKQPRRIVKARRPGRKA